jgi:hypothetical protein
MQVVQQHDNAKLLITLESKSEAQLAAGLARIKELLPPGLLLSVQQNVQTLGDRSARTSFDISNGGLKV